MVASCEGIMCEPASAAPIAGILKAVHEGVELRGQTVVAILTGNGLKDPDAALRSFAEARSVPASIDSVLDSILVPA
jgi:threonine synthase